VHATIDTDSEPALAAAAQIRSVPTLLGFREGLLVYSQPGFQTAGQLEDTVQQIRWLDMDEVRRERAAQHPQAPVEQPADRPAAAVPARGGGIAVGPARYGWPGLRRH
jgi:thioredoxin 1